MTLSSESIQYNLRRYLSVRSSYAPSFSPDDESIAYISDVTGLPQAWKVSLVDDSGPQQLTLSDERIGSVTYGPRTGLVAYTIDQGGDEHFQIHVLDPKGVPIKVTDDPRAIHSWGDWSPEESRITYSSNARNTAYFDLYVHDLRNSKAELVYQHDGNNYPVAWSPAGDSILFTRLNSPFNHDLFLLDLKVMGEIRHLTPHEGDSVFLSSNFDPSGEHVYCVTDQGREFSGIARIGLANGRLEYLFRVDREVEEIALSRDGKELAYTVNEDGYSRLYVSDAECKSAPYGIPIPEGVAGSLRWSNTGRKLAFTFSGSRHNPDIWLYDIESEVLTRITHSSLSGLEPSNFIDAKLIRHESFDGREIPGFLYLPKSGAPPHPLAVYLHGGPESQFRPSFNPLIQFLLGLGFAVVAPNFRGGTGYGRRFTHLDDVYNRMDTVRDVLAFLEPLMKEISVDRRRVVAWGGSYGGFMVLACMYTSPETWSAGVDIVGISNFVTFLKNTGPWRRKLRIAEYGDPDKDKEFLERISPVKNAHLIRAPLFIIHGTNDPRVPAEEAEQITRVLRDLGRDVHLMKFEDEGHGLLKLKNRIVGYAAAVEFLMKHVALSE